MPDFAQPGWLALIAVAAAGVILSLRRASLSQPRQLIAGTLRVLTLAALAIALAAPLAGSYSRHTDVVFALDYSRSIDRESVAEALAFVNRAIAGKQSQSRVGLVVFGADAAVEYTVGSGHEPVREITAHVERGGSDIGRAIEVAVGAFPPAEHRRIVLLSDGRENLGDARAAAAVARSLGVEIHAVPLETSSPEKEIYVHGMTVPSEVRVHEPFEVQTVVHSTGHARAHLVIMRNDVLLHESEVDLKPGANVYSFVEQAEAPGLQEYEAIVNSDADTEQENNRYLAFVRVNAPPRVLHAMGSPQAGRHVSAALKTQGIAVDEVSGNALPGSLRELLDYDLIILNNVSGFDLSLPKMELLENYVRDAGGGVVKIGGDRSYAAGGYYGTPVERLLPVTMNVKTEIQIPSVSVVFVLDRSGSMSAKAHDQDKLAIAKSAALSSIDLLNVLDRVGVLAFDSSPEWVVSPTEVGMRHHIAKRLRELETGGGTNLYPAVEEAHRVMRKERAKVKHLIVLSDGLTEGEKNFDALGARIAADGITISTIALGSDADRQLMARLAALGNGRFYHTDDPGNVPRIFTSETIAIARDLVVEGNIRPRRLDAGELVEGFGASAFPVLGGYQRTFAKAAAQVSLLGRNEDPVLASWRYGLGKSVAFTSDLSGQWGRQWVQWPHFGRFIAQMARWTMRRSGNESLTPRFHWHGRNGEISVDVLDRDDRFINGLNLEAVLVDPARATRRVQLEQTAPGRYRGAFPVSQAGRYYITLSGRGGKEQVGPKTFGVAVPYSPEYLDLGVDRKLLRDIATATGGRVLPLTADSLNLVTAPSPHAPGPRWQIWWPFFLAALILLVAEVAVRKVPVPDAWRERSSAAVSRGQPAPDAGAAKFTRIG
ncbi:MAG TPA: VWA domain-containing protein [Burkholderiales bacterium]|nr:VWA domain-containing protein [Burkholderiales bacterium]